MLVGSNRLLDALRPWLPADAEIGLHANDSYADFMARLMQAEYAFFWNLYSFSLIHRVMAQRPVMFFDEGHMVQILPALHEAGIRLFYDGWRPPVLTLAAALELPALERAATEARQQFARITQGMRQGEAPLDLLRAALSANQRDVLDAQA